MEKYNYKVIKKSKRGKVTKEEVKRVIDLLNDKSSNHLAILKDLKKLMISTNINDIFICSKFLRMGFLHSVARLFEDDNEIDENINLVVIIINKIESGDFKEQENEQYKLKDAVNPFYNIMINFKKCEVYLDIIKIIVSIAKKYPSDVINNNNIKDSYKIILPSNKKYSNKVKKYIYILFKELIKEGIIKKGEEGSEIIEEILFIGEMMNEKKDVINPKEELMNVINDYIIIAKEKGFENKTWNDKNDIIADFLYSDWKKLCKEENNNSNDNEEVIIKEEEKDKIKKFCNNVLSYSLELQMQFVSKLNNFSFHSGKSSNELKCFKTRKNGVFLYLYLSFLFKIYHFEEILPKFLKELSDKYVYIIHCYKYISQLCEDLLKRMMKEEKEMEMNEKNITIIMFIWSARTKKEREEKEVEYLINSTIIIFEWLGKLEEENKEVKGKKNKLIKKENVNEEEMKENLNKTKIFIYKLLVIIENNILWGLDKEKERIMKDRRLGKALLKIVKNHLKNERSLIEKGNKKRIIEHILFSYNNDFDNSDLLSLPSHSFHISHGTITYIIYVTNKYFVDNNTNINKDIFIYLVELLNNYIDIIKIIDECDIKKEIEGEILIESKNNIFNLIKEKLSLNWKDIYISLCCLLSSVDLSSLDYETKKKIKRIINLYFCHSNYDDCNKQKEKEKDNKDVNEIKLNRQFLIDKNNRKDFICSFLDSFTNYYFYSIFNLYYLVYKSEEGCDIIGILMKELSGEIVDRIKNGEGNNKGKERRRYERERIDNVYEYIMPMLNRMIEYTFECRNNVHLGFIRNKEDYYGKEKEIKENKDYISDIIEEEDVRECLTLYLKHVHTNYLHILALSNLAFYSSKSVNYLFSVH